MSRIFTSTRRLASLWVRDMVSGVSGMCAEVDARGADRAAHMRAMMMVLRVALIAAASVLLDDALPCPDEMAPFLDGLWDYLLSKLGELAG